METLVYIIIGASCALLLLILLVWCRFRRRPQPKPMDFAPGIPEVVVDHQTPNNRTPYKRNRRHSPGTDSGDASVVSPRRSPSPSDDYSRTLYSDASTVTENGVENAASGTLFLESTNTKAKMRLKQLWTTPVMVLQLDTSERFNQRLSDLGLQLYASFEPRAHKYGDFSSKTNRFFVYQKEQSELPDAQQDEKFRQLVRSREFTELQRMLYECHAEFLRSVGNSEDFIDSHPIEKLHCWATVQVDGSGHTQHSHPDAVVSGCYYSMIPASGCGQVVFDDPRGPRHPFDSTYGVTPRVGALVMFPSWLLHTVMPTASHEPRVSWAFNVIGDWEEFIGSNSPK